ncbi:MAG TPA: hypothetical protein VHK91_06295 [Flavisolibacter sp.]|jgi:hypothetical protein|nr:hypothetical protein [Flavisolibacter sp.]
MTKSFYDLDYIIEVSERRLEEYNSNYQKVFGSITNILLIYSAIGIFLTPLIQHIFKKDIFGWVFHMAFSAFIIFFAISLGYFIRLLIPVSIAYLDPPSKYYQQFKVQIETLYPGLVNQQKVDDSLKGSYILEINDAIDRNFIVFRRKRSFYYNALIFALIAAIPYVICIGYHLTKKQEDLIYKVQVMSPDK